MMQYEKPIIVIELFPGQDIITNSWGGQGGEDNGEDEPITFGGDSAP